MSEQLADNLRQIVSLFHLTQPIPIPRRDSAWAVMQTIDLSEAAALSLALSFFLRQTGNRAEQLQPPKFHNLLSVTLTKEN